MKAGKIAGESRFGKWAQAWQSRVEGSAKGFYCSYVVLFCAFFLLFWFGVLINGRGFICSVDGLEQQYMFFLMQGEWLRELLSNIFIDHSFIIPMWTDSVGYGADYIVSLENTLGCPLMWLSVFATAETADLLLNAMVPLQLFLAGLAFLGYCRYKRLDAMAGLLGCMVYLFGGYSMIAYTQIFMLYSLILGPLVLWGVDKLFDGESPALFIAGLVLCFLCAVSQAYEVCLVLLVYCLVKVFHLPHRTTGREFALWVLKVLGCIALAALVAGVMFYPQAASLLSQGRLGLERAQGVLYSASYYLKLFEGFIYPVYVGADCYYGFAPVALLAVLGLLLVPALRIERRTRRMLRILFVVMTLFLCLPIVGRVFNGFAYANNRWVWAYTLLVSLIVVAALPALREALVQGDRRVFAGAAVYGLICMVVLAWYTQAAVYHMLVVLFMTLAALLALRNSRALFSVGALCMVALGVFTVSCQWASVYAEIEVKLNCAEAYVIDDDGASVLMGLDDAAESRYDSAETHLWRNGNIANGMLGCSFYNSFYNSCVDDYHQSLGLVTSSMNFSYAGLNSRTTMEVLAGTKYFVVPTEDTSMLPPLYRTVVAEGEVKGVSHSGYEAEVTLPLAWVYSSSVSRAWYDSASIAQRQDVLTQSVVLGASGEGASSGNDEDAAALETYTSEIPATLTLTREDDSDSLSVVDNQDEAEKQAGITIEGNTITTTEANTVVYLNAEIPAGTEGYFMCTGMDFEPAKSTETASTLKQKISAFLGQLTAEPVKDTKIVVYGEGCSQEIWYMTNAHHLYGGKDDWAVNIGYSDSERNTIALQLTQPGTYTFESLGVYAQDVNAVIADAEELAMCGAIDIQKLDGGNGYSCVATAAADGEYLYFRIPYSEGWSATIDGQPVEIEQANVGFMAVELTQGTHNVELHYETPNLRIGAILSCIGILLCVVLAVVSKRRRAISIQPKR